MKDKPDGRHARMEKYLLRKAFDRADKPYLPEAVLWRQKEQFSDGVGYDWVDGLKAHAAKVCHSSCCGEALVPVSRYAMRFCDVG